MLYFKIEIMNLYANIRTIYRVYKSKIHLMYLYPNITSLIYNLKSAYLTHLNIKCVLQHSPIKSQNGLGTIILIYTSLQYNTFVFIIMRCSKIVISFLNFVYPFLKKEDFCIYTNKKLKTQNIKCISKRRACENKPVPIPYLSINFQTSSFLIGSYLGPTMMI